MYIYRYDGHDFTTFPRFECLIHLRSFACVSLCCRSRELLWGRVLPSSLSFLILSFPLSYPTRQYVTSLGFTNRASISIDYVEVEIG
jgi:hypothetical protein